MSQDKLVPLDKEANSSSKTPSSKYIAYQMMEQRGFNPIQKMMDLAEELEDHHRELEHPIHAAKLFSIYKELLKYYAPQPKAVDVSIKQEHSHTLEVVSFRSLVNDRRDHIPAQAQYSGPSLAGALESKTIDVLALVEDEEEEVES